jgi:hypothetical protein
MEQTDANSLYRWFVGLGVDEPVWVADEEPRSAARGWRGAERPGRTHGSNDQLMPQLSCRRAATILREADCGRHVHCFVRVDAAIARSTAASTLRICQLLRLRVPGLDRRRALGWL